MRLFYFLCLPLVALVAPVGAQSAGGASVTGVVVDSLMLRPLRAATVQLVADAGPGRAPFVRAAVSDSLGRYRIDGVPDGRYLIGFLHPRLDSLGLAPPLRTLRIGAGESSVVDLALPSPLRLRVGICGGVVLADSSGVVVGVVRDAGTGRPVPGATVRGAWLELALTRTGVARHVPRLAATTGDDGSFALCGPPSAGLVELVAAHDDDNTDVIDVQVPADGVLHRDLYLGRRAGGRLRGTVVSGTTGAPVAGAAVHIVGGAETRADERGAWTLADVPTGTRLLETRAVGFDAERRVVDVLGDVPPLRSELLPLQALLDAVRVTERFSELRGNGFRARARTGPGHYITPEDIARRGGVVISDALRSSPDLEVRHGGLSTVLVMRNGNRDCRPAIFLDGVHLRGAGAAELDGLAKPHEVTGIEVYAATTVPPQFRVVPCGSVVVWTR